jgi:hypothetical protein
MQKAKFVPKLSLINSILVCRTLSRKGFIGKASSLIAQLNVTFPTPCSFARGRALARTRSLHKLPPFTSALPQPIFKHSPVEVFQQPLSDLKIWSSSHERQANKD